MTTIKTINKIAAQNNCYCENLVFINCRSKLNWKCHRGHTWPRSWAKTKQLNLFCKFCEVIDGLQPKLLAKVKEKEGTVLLTDYFTCKSKLIFICKKNHMWRTMIGDVLYGDHWCAKCNGNAKHTINIAKNIAKERGGECLSNEYINAHEKLLWECNNKHTWPMSLACVKNHNQWCPKCDFNLGEEICRCIFNILFNEEFVKVHPKWLNAY